MMPAKNNQKQANKKQKREAHCLQWDVPIVNSDGKESAHSAGDPDSIPGSRRLPGEGNGHPLQYSCLENSLD